MSTLAVYMRSSVGRKYVMGLTGLGLCVFVLVHMAGNLLIFMGPEAYNRYAYQLTHNKAFLALAELGLVALFGVHILCGVTLNMENRAARAQGYELSPSGAKESTLASQTMLGTGALLLVFVVLHLLHFRFGAHYETAVAGVEMRDMYRLVLEKFRQPGYLAGYAAAMVVLAVHLRHGAWSALQSLGLTQSRFRGTAQLAALGYGLVVAAGFIGPPLYVFFTR